MDAPTCPSWSAAGNWAALPQVFSRLFRLRSRRRYYRWTWCCTTEVYRQFYFLLQQRVSASCRPSANLIPFFHSYPPQNQDNTQCICWPSLRPQVCCAPLALQRGSYSRYRPARPGSRATCHCPFATLYPCAWAPRTSPIPPPYRAASPKSTSAPLLVVGFTCSHHDGAI